MPDIGVMCFVRSHLTAIGRPSNPLIKFNISFIINLKRVAAVTAHVRPVYPTFSPLARLWDKPDPVPRFGCRSGRPAFASICGRRVLQAKPLRDHRSRRSVASGRRIPCLCFRIYKRPDDLVRLVECRAHRTAGPAIPAQRVHAIRFWRIWRLWHGRARASPSGAVRPSGPDWLGSLREGRALAADRQACGYHRDPDLGKRDRRAARQIGLTVDAGYCLQ